MSIFKFYPGLPAVKTAWSYEHLFSHGTDWCRTDGRTDRRTNVAA